MAFWIGLSVGALTGMFAVEGSHEGYTWAQALGGAVLLVVAASLTAAALIAVPPAARALWALW